MREMCSSTPYRHQTFWQRKTNGPCWYVANNIFVINEVYNFSFFLDFYANKHALQQPGCFTHGCSHDKSVFFYYASLFPQYAFIGRDCDSKYSSNTARFSPHHACKERGSFCFDTTPCFPYILSADSKSGKRSIFPRKFNRI